MVRGFNRDMDKYIRQRKDSKLSLRFGRKKNSDEPQPSLWDRFFKKDEPQIPSEDLTDEERERLEAMEDEIESVKQMESADPEHAEIYEEARESLLERFFQSLRLFKHKHQVEDEEEQVLEAEEEVAQEKQEIEEDVKEVLKITHKWLEKLSKRNKEAFRDSEDYEKYTDILVKHGLARRK